MPGDIRRLKTKKKKTADIQAVFGKPAADQRSQLSPSEHNSSAGGGDHCTNVGLLVQWLRPELTVEWTKLSVYLALDSSIVSLWSGVVLHGLVHLNVLCISD